MDDIKKWGKELKTYINSNNEKFKRLDISQCQASINYDSNGSMWKPPTEVNVPLSHPGVEFFYEPPCTMTIGNYQPVPSETDPSKNKVRSDLFAFDEATQYPDIKLEDCLKGSPPLSTVFPAMVATPIEDVRQDVDIKVTNNGDLIKKTLCTFQEIRSQFPIFEPIVATIFLFDVETGNKITCSWRFLANSQFPGQFDITDFITNDLIQGPKRLIIPSCNSVHKQTLFVVSLDRLVLKDGGASIIKYYQKGGHSQEKAGIEDLKNCNQQYTTMTFAYAVLPMNQLTASSDPKSFTFEFYSTPSVSEIELRTQLPLLQKRKEKEKPLSITLSFQFKCPSSSESESVETLPNLFNLTPLCPLKYENDLIVCFDQAKFHFPRSIRGRNILMQVKLISSGHDIPIRGEDTIYTTRCQYHVENPTFHDDVVFHLPSDLAPDSFLDIQFFHAAVKLSACKAREPCGSARLKLFQDNSNALVPDGPHVVPISYVDLVPDCPEDTSENNSLYLKTYLRSSLYSTDPSVAAIFSYDTKSTYPDVKPWIDPNSCNTDQEREFYEQRNTQLIIHLYPVLDQLLDSILHKNEDAFRALFLVLSSYPLKSIRGSNSYVNQLAFYVKFGALRKKLSAVEKKKLPEGLHIPLSVMWANYLQSAAAQPDDFIFSWVLLELITKSLLIKATSKPDPNAKKPETTTKKSTKKLDSEDTGPVLNLVRQLVNFYPRLRETPNHAKSLCTDLALFARDALEYDSQDKSFFISLLEVILTMFSLPSIQPKNPPMIVTSTNPTPLTRTFNTLPANFKKQAVDANKQITETTLNKDRTLDRDCLRSLLNALLTPKVLVYLTAPIISGNRQGSTLFQYYFEKLFEQSLSFSDHTNIVFKQLFHVLRLFTPGDPYSFDEVKRESEQSKVAQQLGWIPQMIGRNVKKIKTYESNESFLYILAVCHFVYYYNPPRTLNDDHAACLRLMVTRGRHYKDINKVRGNESNEAAKVSRIEHMTDAVIGNFGTIGSSSKGQLRTRQFASMKKLGMLSTNKREVDESASETLKAFDGLAFAIQSLLISFIPHYSTLHVLNSIIVPLFEMPLNPNLEHIFCGFPLDSDGKSHGQRRFTDDQLPTVSLFFKAHPEVIFFEEDSKLHKVFSSIIRRPTRDRYQVLVQLRNAEVAATKARGSVNYSRCSAFIAKALYRFRADEEFASFAKGTVFSEEVSNVAELDRLLNGGALKGNPDFYSDALFKLAEHLDASPDARVKCLLKLSEFNASHKCQSEAVVDLLASAALVAQFLTLLGRIGSSTGRAIIQAFQDVCPSAIEPLNEKLQKDPPKIRGFCSSKYFTEFGLIYLVQSAMQLCKQAQLFELTTKVHHLLGPLAEERKLWKVISQSFASGSLSWKAVEKFSSGSDRLLGTYYRVQFQSETGGVYIYHEQIPQLWSATPMYVKSAEILADGKPVEGVNEGSELNPDKMQPDKYYVHVKAVLPFYPNGDNRVTVFEKNNNVQDFYFDLPFYKGPGKTLENTWLRRISYHLTHPIPYLVKRVFVDKSNIDIKEYSPIEKCCLDLANIIEKIDEAIAKEDYPALQPLLQGSLLTQVNDGPKKMAEVFLTGGIENEHTDRMRELFREFLRANTEGVKLHGHYVTTMPVWQMLQEQLEPGLNDLTSSLQPFLK